VLSSAAGVEPLWVAAAGAAAISGPALARRTTTERTLALAAEPSFLLFVLGLGVIVHAASEHGLGSAARALLPDGEALPALLLVAAVSALLANLVNNLPATLILVPATALAAAADRLLPGAARLAELVEREGVVLSRQPLPARFHRDAAPGGGFPIGIESRRVTTASRLIAPTPMRVASIVREAT
jgi:hypothetical protein